MFMGVVQAFFFLWLSNPKSNKQIWFAVNPLLWKDSSLRSYIPLISARSPNTSVCIRTAITDLSQKSNHVFFFSIDSWLLCSGLLFLHRVNSGFQDCLDIQEDKVLRWFSTNKSLCSFKMPLGTSSEPVKFVPLCRYCYCLIKNKRW